MKSANYVALTSHGGEGVFQEGKTGREGSREAFFARKCTAWQGSPLWEAAAAWAAGEWGLHSGTKPGWWSRLDV